jgi:hypothetical protein
VGGEILTEQGPNGVQALCHRFDHLKTLKIAAKFSSETSESAYNTEIHNTNSHWRSGREVIIKAGETEFAT